MQLSTRYTYKGFGIVQCFVTPITACTIEYYTTMSDLFLDYLDQHCIERAKN